MSVPTQPRYLHRDGSAIVFDPALAADIDEHSFEPDYWRQRGAITQTASGRAEVHFIQADAARWVLRHYRRGGLIGRLVDDQYVWTGLALTRPWREWHLLADLYSAGFPVPQPVAARVQHQGLFYRADLITSLLADAEPLADVLLREALTPVQWAELGKTIARFHRAGIHHRDINARNVLWRAAENRFFLLDFDGAKRNAGAAKLALGIARLRTSLEKLAGAAAARGASFHYDGGAWQALYAGYKAGP